MKDLSYRDSYTHDEREGVKVIVSKDDLARVYLFAQTNHSKRTAEDSAAIIRIANTLGK